MRTLKKGESNMNITINDAILRRAHIKASILNISLKEYISKLIEVNTKNIADLK